MAWLLMLSAGIGFATGRSLFKMWLGFRRAGVFSAGNGVAMRASVLGVLCQDLDRLKRLNHISTTLTHTDPKAEQGSSLIALLAWLETYQNELEPSLAKVFLAEHLTDFELLSLLDDYQSDDKGVTGYMYHTVPAVYQAW